MGLYGSQDPTDSAKALKEGLGFIPIKSTPPCYNNTIMQYETKKHKIHTDKHK